MSTTPFAPEQLFVFDNTSKTEKGHTGAFDIINRAEYVDDVKAIGTVHPYGNNRFCTHDEAMAYAKLFAASPELLGALKELLECDYTSGTHLYTAQIRAKAAIEKATT